jgi:carbon-monoxide dehydrogenase large subunit
VKGAPGREKGFGEVASLVYRHCYGQEACEVEPGLEATRYFRMPNVYHRPEVEGRFSAYPSWPNGACVAVVEVDPETGAVKVLRCVNVHDSGTTINPLLADANLHGGIAQGLGGALYEHLVYDENAQLKTATFMDYTIPTAADVPSYEIAHQTTPSPFTPLGTKGVGESSVAAPLGAVVGAVEDALAQAGVRVRLMETPLTPSRVWRAMRSATQAGG